MCKPVSKYGVVSQWQTANFGSSRLHVRIVSIPPSDYLHSIYDVLIEHFVIIFMADNRNLLSFNVSGRHTRKLTLVKMPDKCRRSKKQITNNSGLFVHIFSPFERFSRFSAIIIKS